MTYFEFNCICVKHLITPSIVLENESIVDLIDKGGSIEEVEKAIIENY